MVETCSYPTICEAELSSDPRKKLETMLHCQKCLVADEIYSLVDELFHDNERLREFLLQWESAEVVSNKDRVFPEHILLRKLTEEQLKGETEIVLIRVMIGRGKSFIAFANYDPVDKRIVEILSGWYGRDEN